MKEKMKLGDKVGQLVPTFSDPAGALLPLEHQGPW